MRKACAANEVTDADVKVLVEHAIKWIKSPRGKRAIQKIEEDAEELERKILDAQSFEETHFLFRVSL